MCSLEMELSQAVKLSSVARKRTQVNFKILNILLMMLSKREEKQQRVNECKYLSWYFCLQLDSFFPCCLIIIIIIQAARPCHSKESPKIVGGLFAVWGIFLPVCLDLSSLFHPVIPWFCNRQSYKQSPILERCCMYRSAK